MNCQRKILLDILTDDEAFILLKTVANLKNDSPLTIIATKVAKECGRLPVAIVSVGKALRGKPQHGWERALKKLQEGEHQEIRDLSGEENVFRSLKFSFDELHREETKRCWLLCSLFPEDHEICLEDLIRYAHGWGLFRRTRSIDDTMSDILDAVDELQDSHLLLEAEKKGYVKMHDLVRDIALLIGRSYSVKMGGGIGFEEWPTDGSFKDYAIISMLDNEIKRLPDQLDSPNLEMLLLTRKEFILPDYFRDDEESTNIPDNCFEGMEKLKVLSINGGILSMRSLENLTNLRTLELKDCKVDLKGLELLENLKSLEILSFFNSAIQELPNEVEELKNLKVLDLSYCYIYKDFNSNIIRNLSKLEELHVGIIEQWDDGNSNARLMDIHRSSLPHLAILSLTYRQKIPEDFAFPNLNGYHIHICDCRYPQFKSRLRYPAKRILCIVLNENIVNACKSLFANVYELQLKCNDKRFRNMMPDMSETGFQDLSSLHVSICYMDSLVNTSKQKDTTKSVFSNLRELAISWTDLKEICEGQPPEGFLEKLETITIKSCNKMVTIFPAKLLKGMKKLEIVMIEGCQILENVFQLNGLEEAKLDYLSHLKNLKLSNLGALTCICKGPTSLVKLSYLVMLTIYNCKSLSYLFSMSIAQNLQRLEKLDVYGCDKLKYIITEKEEQEETHSVAHHQQLCLQNLKIVRIKECHQLKYVFPITMARDLPNLTELVIIASDQLSTVFEIEYEADLGGGMKEIVFPELSKLYLEELPRLVAFCPRGYHFKFLSLRDLKVKGCPEITTSFNAASDASVQAELDLKTEVGSTHDAVGSTHEAVRRIQEGCEMFAQGAVEGQWIQKKFLKMKKNNEEDQELHQNSKDEEET